MSDATTHAFKFPPGDDGAAGTPFAARRAAAHPPPSPGAAESGDDDGQRELPPERVAEIRARIEAGDYIDDHKLDVVVERLLDELGGG